MIRIKSKLSLFPVIHPIFRILNQTVLLSTSKVNFIKDVQKKLQCNETPMQKVQSESSVKDENSSAQNTFKTVLDYMKHANLEDLIEKLPKQYLTKKVVLKEIFLINRSVVRNFVSLIIDDLLKNTSFVVEVNPGIGLLTQELLDNNVPKIHVFKNNMNNIEPLQQLQSKYPDRLYLEKFNFFYLQKELYRDEMTQENRFEEVFKDVQCKDWKSDTCMQVIGVLPNVLFIKHLIVSLMLRNSIISLGRPVFYFALSPSLWMILTATNISGYFWYRPTSVLFQTLLDYSFLGVLPRQAFLPWKRNILTRSQYVQYKLLDNTDMYVVKIEPKKNLYDIFTNLQSLQQFCYFIKYHMKRRSNKVIPELEKWISGCGVNLIANNYDVFTQFGDLSSQQLLCLFKDFSSWSGFEESLFPVSVEEWLKKDFHNSEAETSQHFSNDQSET